MITIKLIHLEKQFKIKFVIILLPLNQLIYIMKRMNMIIAMNLKIMNYF